MVTPLEDLIVMEMANLALEAVMSKNPNLHQHLSQNQLHSLNQRQLHSLNLNAFQTTMTTPSHNTQESVSPS
jgi:hypothetical protein